MATASLLTVPSFLLKSLATQILAAAACLMSWSYLPSFPIAISIASVVAMTAATFVQLPTSWRILNGFFPLAALLVLAIEIPSAIWLVPLLGIAAVHGPALLTRVPYYPTPKAAYGLILAELPTDRPFRFLDVGCGFGDLLLLLAHHRPNGTFIGIELGPLPLLVARIRTLRSRRTNVQILCRDMWTYSLRECDYVYTFLSPAAMEKMWQKATREMPPGSTFITNSFPVPAEATEVLPIRDERASHLFIHRIGDS
jgi:SAM-dependent methyltransferase